MPTKPIARLPRTVVDLRCLGDLVERMVVEIRRRHPSGETLRWRVDDIDYFNPHAFFQHQDPERRD